MVATCAGKPLPAKPSVTRVSCPRRPLTAPTAKKSITNYICSSLAQVSSGMDIFGFGPSPQPLKIWPQSFQAMPRHIPHQASPEGFPSQACPSKWRKRGADGHSAAHRKRQGPMSTPFRFVLGRKIMAEQTNSKHPKATK